MITQQEHNIVVQFAQGHSLAQIAHWQHLKDSDIRDIVEKIQAEHGVFISSPPALREWLPRYQAELLKHGRQYRPRLADIAHIVLTIQADERERVTEQPQPPATPTLDDIRARAQAKRAALLGSPLIPLEQTIVDALHEGMTLRQIEGNMIMERHEFATLVETIKAKLGELPSGDESPGCELENDPAFQ